MNLNERLKTLIARTNALTRSDNVYIAKFGAYLIGANMFNTALSFGLSIAFGHLADKSTFGTYQYILSLYGVFSAFALSEMATALNQAVANGHDASIKPAISASRRFGLLGSAAFLVTGAILLARGNSSVAISLLIIAPFFPLVESFKLYTGYLAGKRRFDLNSTYASFAQAVYVAGMVAAMFISHTVYALVVAFIVTNLITGFINYRNALRAEPISNDADPGVVRYGLALSVASLLSVAATNIDRLFGFVSLGSAPVAQYVFATAPLDKIKGLTNPIGDLAFPKFATKDESYRRTLYLRLIQMFVLSLVIISAWYFASPYIYKYLFPKYQDVVSLSRLYSLVWLALPFSLFSVMFEAKKNIRAIYAQRILNPSFRIAAVFYLGGIYGITGLVWAALATAFFRSILAIILSLTFRDSRAQTVQT